MPSWWGSEDMLSRRIDLDDIELIGNPWITVGVPYGSSDEFKKNVFAGASAYSLRLKSIDYTLKHYIEKQNMDEIKDKESDLIFKVTSTVKNNVKEVLNYLMNIKKPDVPSLFAAGAAFVRLQNTFKGAVLTLRTGLHFETQAMERMILEQLAWIFAVHNYKGDFFQLEPTKCIKSLKTFIPHAGLLYGNLSEKLHISPKSTLDYISVERDNLYLYLSDISLMREDAYILLILMDMYCLVGEYIYSNLISNYKFIERTSEDKIIPLETRITKSMVNEFEKALFNFDEDI